MNSGQELTPDYLMPPGARDAEPRPGRAAAVIMAGLAIAATVAAFAMNALSPIHSPQPVDHQPPVAVDGFRPF